MLTVSAAQCDNLGDVMASVVVSALLPATVAAACEVLDGRVGLVVVADWLGEEDLSEVLALVEDATRRAG